MEVHYMKKKLLFIPVILSALSLAGCNNNKVTKSEQIEYKFDEPMEIAKLFSGRVRIDYPYESVSLKNYRDINNTYSYEIRDKSSVVLEGLKKVETFQRVETINPSTDECLEFYAYLLPETYCYQAHFTLYADGCLTYGIQRVITEYVRYNFTFDADIAKSIIDGAKEEIEEAKVAEEELLSELTMENYIQVLEYSTFRTSRSAKRDGMPVYEGAIENSLTALNAIKGLEYTKVEASVGQKNFGEGAVLISAHDKPDASKIKHAAYLDQTNASINKDGTYVRLYFNITDEYGRWITDTNDVSIDSKEGKKAVDSILEMVSNNIPSI